MPTDAPEKVVLLSLDALEGMQERVAKATPGPWELRTNVPYSWPQRGVVIFHGRFAENETIGRWENEKYGRTQANVDFIAAARTDLPRTIGAARWAREAHTLLEIFATNRIHLPPLLARQVESLLGKVVLE